MKHLGTQTLITKRLVLRPFRTEDAGAMWENWAGDPEVTRYLTWPPHADVSVSRAVLKDWTASYRKPDFYQWAVVPKDGDDRPIGSISVVHGDDEIRMVHIGYCIGRAWWHRGITSEALAALLDFFFTRVGVNRVESRHDPRNPNSGLVMQKCGMRYEGTHRQADINNQGGLCDSVFYAVLADEYGGAK